MTAMPLGGNSVDAGETVPFELAANCRIEFEVPVDVFWIT
jgi:hypothetical protein